MNWVVTAVLGLTFLAAITVVPWYGIVHGYSAWAWTFFAIFMVLNGIGIGSGYHRLWSHRTYEAHPILKWFLAIIGGMSLQNSIIVWCARHRVHHRDVDDNDKDPYSIGRGFWFAHIGWMLKDYPSGEVDYSLVPDLLNDPVAAFQHRWYWTLVWLTNLALPLFLGWLTGDMLGMFLLAGIARLVLSHHVTFFINSLAHMWGTQPYTDENSARDNHFLALNPLVALRHQQVVYFRMRLVRAREKPQTHTGFQDFEGQTGHGIQTCPAEAGAHPGWRGWLESTAGA
jgi:stearoyl-CoA desaturase (delta-9 desaturase)